MAKVIGYAGGAFDLFHVGHLNLLRRARSQCDFLIASVASDELLIARKGRAPIVPLAESLEIVRNIAIVDQAIEENQTNRLDLWHTMHFDVLFKGNDWKGKPNRFELEQLFGSVGVHVIYFPYTVHTSSAILRRTLAMINEETSNPQVAQ